MKRLLLAIPLLVLAACAEQAATPDTSMGKRAPMEWTFEQTGTGEYDEPYMELTLTDTLTGKALFRGECTGTANETSDVEGAVSAVLCWWAGGGDQFAVFIEDAEELHVRHRWIDEESGYGEWEEQPLLP